MQERINVLRERSWWGLIYSLFKPCRVGRSTTRQETPVRVWHSLRSGDVPWTVYRFVCVCLIVHITAGTTSNWCYVGWESAAISEKDRHFLRNPFHFSRFSIVDRKKERKRKRETSFLEFPFDSIIVPKTTYTRWDWQFCWKRSKTKFLPNDSLNRSIDRFANGGNLEHVHLESDMEQVARTTRLNRVERQCEVKARRSIVSIFGDRRSTREIYAWELRRRSLRAFWSSETSWHPILRKGGKNLGGPTVVPWNRDTSTFKCSCNFDAPEMHWSSLIDTVNLIHLHMCMLHYYCLIFNDWIMPR